MAVKAQCPDPPSLCAACTRSATDRARTSSRPAPPRWRGGAAILQYRDKTSDSARRRHEASALQALCARHGVPLIVNDDVELAAVVGAAGVHLGEDDAALSAARARLGAGAIIGVSCYDSLERARHFAAAGADYLAFGAFFASPTKPARTQRDAGAAARGHATRSAAGGDRRHHRRQCAVPDRGRRRRGRGDLGAVRRARRGRRGAALRRIVQGMS